MNLSQFFEHWQIVENPFRGEEARHDSVFARMGGSGGSGGGGDGAGNGRAVPTTVHSDFEKILGDPARPASAIVFGEKGSGKTAIRLQLEERIAAYNAAHPQARALLVAYDDLNPFLDRFYARMSAGGKLDPGETFKKLRQVDHLDALVTLVVPRMVDALLNDRSDEGALDLGSEPRRTARRLDAGLKRDLLLLQTLYDRPENADIRTRRLRRALRVPMPFSYRLWTGLAWLGWIPGVAVLLWAWLGDPPIDRQLAGYIGLGLLVLWLAAVAKRYAWDRLVSIALARRIRKQVRITNRTDGSYARSLEQVDPVTRDPAHLPAGESDQPRYAMVQRLRRVLAAFGYASMVVVIDRVDEPTLISGDPDRMRAVVWPILNNKFLQQSGIGFKMLLPIELRHALFKESSSFFQEARLDKQNLVERLSWTGAMLYDLCDARLKACRPAAAEPIGLLDLFAEDVTRQDLVDALDQMHQPRDAFKFLYACMVEHCSNVTAEQNEWKIPRLVLETVRKQQSDRVQQLYRGIRPA